MTIFQAPTPKLREALSNANPNQLADILAKLDYGRKLSCGEPRYLRALSPNTAPVNPYIPATTSPATPLAAVSPALPQNYANDAPAAFLLRATARAGGVTGELTCEPYGTTPATTQVGIAPNGDIVTLTADAVTNLDVLYVPEFGETFEFTLPVPTSGLLVLPTTIGGIANRPVILLREAELLTVGAGGVAGKKIVLVPAASAPATTLAKLDLVKLTVKFAAADVGASAGVARVRVFVASKVSEAALESPAPF